ncbi:hypothetical protein GHO26_20505 [Pseudomonas helleri]|uniref:hypothetical protein n=1 Tax=Pseudomonas helleri TaxID=1608996 RepID=UPI0012968263|nr:hypothetical protein [Pseudomonas helleri]MQU60149.1 hypothetical protein [Pseudomonas helleri]
MEKEFVYNPLNPCIVLHNGKDIGALVDGRLYRFDSCGEVYLVLDSVVFQYGQEIGKIEGFKIILNNTGEILELFEK